MAFAFKSKQRQKLQLHFQNGHQEKILWTHWRANSISLRKIMSERTSREIDGPDRKGYKKIFLSLEDQSEVPGSPSEKDAVCLIKFRNWVHPRNELYSAQHHLLCPWVTRHQLKEHWWNTDSQRKRHFCHLSWDHHQNGGSFWGKQHTQSNGRTIGENYINCSLDIVCYLQIRSRCL